MSDSQIRQNFYKPVEDGINEQINMELYAHYVYLSMSYYFDRDDVALPGFKEYFKKNSDDELKHAEMLMAYQNARGGKIKLKDIQKPEKDDWISSDVALQAALELEKKVNLSLLNLHSIAEKENDPQTMDFLDDMLKEQVEEIKSVADKISNLKRVGAGLGEYLFDRYFYREK